MTNPGCIILVCVICFFAIVGCELAFLVIDGYKKPRYYAAINSFSGLDPAKDLRRPSLDPVFNISLGVASDDLRHGECVVPGTAVKVSYRGSPLASGTAVQLCAWPRTAPSEQSLVAWGRGVRLPGFRLDNLAADARDDVGKIVTCTARRVGDAAALQVPCDMSNMGYDWKPSPKDLHGGA
ncbi:hypothetical protein VPH35_005356 [Triticum aestivum]